MPKALRAYSLDLLLLVCLILAGLRLTGGLEQVVDLTLFDETGYLYAGLSLPTDGLMPPAWAPLYGVWYFALSRLEPDPVALYYLNFRILSVAAPALVFLLLRACGLPRLVGLLCAWFFLLSVGNLPVWPKPGSFALCLAILFLIAARDPRVPTGSVLLLAVGALLCSYVRPEYALAYVLLTGLYLALLWRRRARLNSRVELAQLIGFVLASFALVFTFGLAALDRNNDRGFEAFAQHYAINWAAWNQVPLDPWTEYETAIRASFDDATSLGEALAANPGAIARHVASNLAGYPTALAGTFLAHFTPLLPAGEPWSRTVGIWLLGLAALGAAAWGLYRHRGELRARLRERGLQLLMFALLCGPALASAIIIYPRTHYLLLQGVLLALAAGLLAAGRGASGRGATAGLAATALALTLLTPPVGATWYGASLAGHGSPNRDTILFIRALGVAGPTDLLEAEGGFHVYLGPQFRRVPHFLKEGGAEAFLRERGVDLVVVSEQLRRDRRYADDPEWRAILADPGAAGFSRVAIPGTDRELLIKR
jgi:hypothetical protein